MAAEEMENINVENASTHINILPPETVGLVLSELSVVDRLQCEGVNRRWKKIVWDMGWTQQTKLSYDIVFKGATESQKKKFKNESLKRLFRRFGANLTELNLEYFPISTIYSLQNDTNIFRWLYLLPKLAELDILGINFRKAAYFLPQSLIELHSSGPFDEDNLEALADKCPNLESIHFSDYESINKFRFNNYNDEPVTKLSICVMNEFFGRCQNLKTIHLVGNFIQTEANVSLTSLEQLECLEELHLDNVEAFDDAALRALIAGCPRLRKLKMEYITVSEEAIRKLDKHPNLVDFELIHRELVGTIETEINGQWKIKKLNHFRSRMFSDDSVLLEMLKEIRSNFGSRSFVDGLIQLGYLPLFIKSLNSTNSELQYNAAWVVARIAAGTKNQTKAVVEAGAVPELLKLLDSENDSVREQSLKALKNIIEGKTEYRDLCIDLGIVERLLKMVKMEKSMDNLRQIISSFEYICKNPPLPVEIVKSILPVLEKFIKNNDETFLLISIWILSDIAKGGNEQIQLIVDFGAVPHLITLLDDSDRDVQFAALFALSNIASGTNEQIQSMVDLWTFKMIPAMFVYDRGGAAELCVRFLGNMANKEDRVQTVFDTHLVPAIIQILVHCWSSEQEEAVRAISNIAKFGRSEHVHYLVDYGVIHPLCKLLRVDHDELLLDILVALKNILEKSDTRIEEVCMKIKRCPGSNEIWDCLEDEGSEEMKKVACEIIEKFFPPSEEEQIENDGDYETLKNSIRTVSDIAEGGNERIQLIVDSGVVPHLVTLLDHPERDVQFAALFALSNIASGTDEQVQFMLDLGALKKVQELISQHEKNIGHTIEELCVRFLGNIASKEDRVQKVLDTQLVPAIIQILINCSGSSQNEAIRTISNIAKYGRSEHIRYLVDYGVIPPLCEFLRTHCNYNKVLLDIFVALKNIFEKSGTRAKEVCKEFKSCPGSFMIWYTEDASEEMKKVAGEIIEKFFPPSEEDQTEIDEEEDQFEIDEEEDQIEIDEEDHQ